MFLLISIYNFPKIQNLNNFLCKYIIIITIISLSFLFVVNKLLLWMFFFASSQTFNIFFNLCSSKLSVLTLFLILSTYIFSPNNNLQKQRNVVWTLSSGLCPISLHEFCWRYSSPWHCTCCPLPSLTDLAFWPSLRLFYHYGHGQQSQGCCLLLVIDTNPLLFLHWYCGTMSLGGITALSLLAPLLMQWKSLHLLIPDKHNMPCETASWNAMVKVILSK